MGRTEGGASARPVPEPGRRGSAGRRDRPPLRQPGLRDSGAGGLPDPGSGPGERPLATEVEVIRTAAKRAARLTSQLLAFSSEQALQPRLVDLGRAVRECEGLLRRVIGEDFRIETELTEDLPPIRVDPGQLEEVIINLAVNARDAMPEGGTLRLATWRVDSGDGAPDDAPEIAFVQKPFSPKSLVDAVNRALEGP